MTSTAYTYLEPSGVIIPDTSATQATVNSWFTNAFGSDLILTPDTPQGLIATTDVLALNTVINNNAAVANQINPNLAGGVFLDAILALTGQQRTAQTQTYVPGVTVTGVAGTLIPEGSLAATAAGDQFSSAAPVTIPNGGMTTVDFYSVAYGPIPCAESALTVIVSGVLGWETVTNGTAGTLGTTTQSDQAARAFRLNTLAFNGISLAEAITSALYATPGVTSLSFQENVAATTQTINGISMVSHSVYACVNGGTDLAVASALLENKSSGAAWNGGTTVDVIEPASGQVYAVTFDRPTPVPILIVVTTTNGSDANITQAILDYFAGNIPNMPGAAVGASISAFDISAAILAENPGFYISNVTLALYPDGSPATTPIAIAVNEIAYTQNSYISVVTT